MENLRIDFHFGSFVLGFFICFVFITWVCYRAQKRKESKNG